VISARKEQDLKNPAKLSVDNVRMAIEARKKG
jgi:hypothetical protein